MLLYPLVASKAPKDLGGGNDAASRSAAGSERKTGEILGGIRFNDLPKYEGILEASEDSDYMRHDGWTKRKNGIWTRRGPKGMMYTGKIDPYAPIKAIIEEDYTKVTLEHFPDHESWLFQSLSRHSTAESVDKFFKVLKERNLLSYITEDDVEASWGTVCQAFGHHVFEIGSSLKTMSEACILELIKTLPGPNVRMLPVELVERDPIFFVTYFPHLDDMSADQIRVLSQFPHACTEISARSARAMTDPKRWKALSPECFAAIPGIYEANLSLVLQSKVMPGDIFSMFEAPTIAINYAHMNAKQVELYGSRIDGAKPFIMIPQLSNAAMAGLQPEHLMTYFRKTKNVTDWLDRWKYFPVNSLIFFRDPHDLCTIIQHIGWQDFSSMTADQLSILLEYPTACHVVPEGAKINVEVVPKIFINSKCFANLPQSMQLSILDSKTELSKNLLEFVSLKHVERMRNGIYSLNKIRATNRAEMIKRLGSRVKDDLHICKLVRNPGTLKNLKIFREAMPAKCWKNLGFKVKLKHVIKDPKLFAGRPKALKSILQNTARLSDWKEFSTKDMLRLTSGKAGRECKYLTARHKGIIIAAGKLAGLSPECVANMKFLNEIDATQMLYMRPEAFAALDKRAAHGLNYDNLLNTHLEQISSQVAFTETIGGTLSRTVLEMQVTPERLNYLPARVWGTVPENAFSIFRNAEIFGSISGEKMAYWTVGQVKMIPTNVFGKLLPDQALFIGTLSAEPTQMNVYLGTAFKHFNKATQDVLHSRVTILSNGTVVPRPAWPTVTTLLIAAVALFL